MSTRGPSTGTIATVIVIWALSLLVTLGFWGLVAYVLIKFAGTL